MDQSPPFDRMAAVQDKTKAQLEVMLAVELAVYKELYKLGCANSEIDNSVHRGLLKISHVRREVIEEKLRGVRPL